MCWLILTFEAAAGNGARAVNAPRVELAGQLTARLWLPVLAGALIFPLMNVAGPELRGVLRAYAWPAAALMAWFPLTALRTAEAGDIHNVMSTALRRWVSGLLPFIGWVGVAGVGFFAFHVMSRWLVSLIADHALVAAPTAAALRCIGTGLAVWMLGAWVAIQVDRLPPGVNYARPARKSAPA
jgi:hypothetical protein